MTLQERIDELCKNPWVKGTLTTPTQVNKIDNGDSIYQVAFLEVNTDTGVATTRNQSFYVLVDGTAYYHISKPNQSLL